MFHVKHFGAENSITQKMFHVKHYGETELSKVIAVTNQKGGVGKSTTTINLSACLAEKGVRVLAVDSDPQGNTTSGFGIQREGILSIYEALIGEKDAKECIIKEPIPGMDIIPANIDLTGAEIDLLDYEDKEFRLKDALDNIKNDYDYVLIDCPPSLSILTINSLIAADSLLIPLQCEYYALEGLALLKKTIDLIRTRLNSSLEISGIVFTMYDSRTNLSKEVVENVTVNLDEYIYKTIIPRNIRLAEAPSYGLPVIVYDPKCSGADSYRRLADEFIKRERN